MNLLKKLIYGIFFVLVFTLTISCENEVEDNIEKNIKDLYDCISIEQAILTATEAGDTPTTEQYYVYGVIEEVYNGIYGEMVITNGKNSLSIYGVYSQDGSTRYDALEEKPDKGDEIVLLGSLNLFNGQPQMDRGYIQAFTDHKLTVDNNEFKLSTIKEARELNSGEKLQVTGVVAQITYAFGKVPNGFFLVDNTESIYVYGKSTAATVKVGNKVTIAGEKTYYISDEEQSSAQKYGYIGCCQVQNAIILENDNNINSYDKSWIRSTTIKEIMNTPFSVNHTTTIYKVNALVKKSIGSGFTNYYFDDLDGTTGSYTYTACNGSDFAWLDKFDGKICTVYLSPINAKSTSSGCVYRFLPIEVIDENYQFNIANSVDFALEYYAKDQLLNEYTADPAIELILSVSNTVLGFDNVTFSYESSNTDIIYFENVGDKTIFHTNNVGTTDVIITANYQDYTASITIEIKVSKPEEIPALTVIEAINTPDDTEVTVKGIVASSLVNQSGFYLVDETGVIAVTGAKNDIALLSVGDEVIVRGTKDHKVKDNYTGAGQVNIYNSTILVNNYGNHQYSTSSFDTTKDLNYLYGLDHNEDHSNEVYVLNVIVRYVSDNFSTSYKLESLDGTVRLSLYCSGASQYKFLSEFVDKEVTVEVAICNWNSKTYYTGCVMSVTYEGTKVINTLNFTN